MKGAIALLRILSRAPIAQQILTQIGQAQRLVQFPIAQQPGVGCDLGPVKFQLQATIESHPQSLFFACTRWVFRFLLL